jgi:hypothetical protein
MMTYSDYFFWLTLLSDVGGASLFDIGIRDGFHTSRPCWDHERQP